MLLQQILLHIDKHNNSYKNEESLPILAQSLHRWSFGHRNIFYLDRNIVPLISRLSLVHHLALVDEYHVQIQQTSFDDTPLREILLNNDLIYIIVVVHLDRKSVV